MLSERGRLLTEKNKDLITINYKSTEIESFNSVTHPYKFGERYAPYASR